MVWLIGTASSIAGAAVWALIAYVISSQREKSGVVAGDWYQVTYDPDDINNVWSIEWVEARHRADTVKGAMWRIYPRYFDRRWLFQGRCHNSSIRAQYWADRGNGGEGGMKLTQVLPKNYLGRFEEEKAARYEIGPSFIEFAAPIEWIKVPSDDEPAVVARLRKVPEAEMLANLPRRIRRRLRNSLENDTTGQRVLRSLAFGSCLTDLSGPLANEVERVRALALEHEARETIPPQPDPPDAS